MAQGIYVVRPQDDCDRVWTRNKRKYTAWEPDKSPGWYWDSLTVGQSDSQTNGTTGQSDRWDRWTFWQTKQDSWTVWQTGSLYSLTGLCMSDRQTAWLSESLTPGLSSRQTAWWAGSRTVDVQTPGVDGFHFDLFIQEFVMLDILDSVIFISRWMLI